MKYEGEVRELELIPTLVELGTEGFTGALRFENDSIIKIVYFKDGAVLSASTNDRSDSIDEILLKSGKVSREHVKQALTKRKDEETLGDALLGLGFITRKELSWARRVQLIGILRSIIGWESGSYTLVADYLPKREEGPSFQFEQIVLELVLTDANRSKFDALLESGAVIFRPSALFDERFPNLGLNQEAASVVRLINGSRTASDVVAESTSDAFNVYKLMHALHLLGLLEKSTDSFDLGTGSAGGHAPIEPTVEMPMDFGDALRGGESVPATEDYDFGTPEGPGVDLSWQDPANQEDLPSSESTGALLPSIDDALVTESRGYDYEPSVPDGGMPPIVLPDESTSRYETREPAASIAAASPAPPQKPVVGARPSGGGSGGAGRKIAFAVVGLVIVAAVAVAGYLYFMKPGAEPEPSAIVAQQPSAESAATVTESEIAEEPAAEDMATAPTSTEAAPPAEPVAATPTPPKPAPTSTAKPTPQASTGRYAELARTNAIAARDVPYTVQFALLCQEYSVENAIKVGGSDFWFVPIDYQGRSCYRAFWGRYSSRAEAERGAERIPSSLRGGKTVVVEPAKLSN